MNLSDFDYALPPELIAQTPIEPRDASRLMVVNRATVEITHSRFNQLVQFLRSGDVLIFNDTRVIPARLAARKSGTGGQAEVLLLKRRAPLTWEALVGGKGLHVGSVVDIEGNADLHAVVMEDLGGPRWLVQFSKPITPLLDEIGQTPLPPYIHEVLANRERYQTVYAHVPGSAAAPTAGLHFTLELITQLQTLGVQVGYVTLHVGLDTFAPVSEDNVEEHAMHGEWREVSEETATLVNLAKREGRRIIAVGTTSVRTLESADQGDGQVAPHSDITHLFILPGHRFRVVDAMITNFHLPKSTLLMLVSAFAGRDMIHSAYETAKREGYRFYSFGDAMLIL